MRATALALTATLFVVTPGFSQTPAPSQHPYGLDPYKPSDAFFLRNYGAALVAQTPLLELAPGALTIANRTADRARVTAASFADLGPVKGCGFLEIEARPWDLVINATAASRCTST